MIGYLWWNRYFHTIGHQFRDKIKVKFDCSKHLVSWWVLEETKWYNYYITLPCLIYNYYITWPYFVYNYYITWPYLVYNYYITWPYLVSSCSSCSQSSWECFWCVSRNSCTHADEVSDCPEIVIDEHHVRICSAIYSLILKVTEVKTNLLTQCRWFRLSKVRYGVLFCDQHTSSSSNSSSSSSSNSSCYQRYLYWK